MRCPASRVLTPRPEHPPRGSRLPSWQTCPRLSFEPDARPRPPLPCVPGAGREVSRRVGGAAVGGQEGGTGSPRCPSLRGTAPRRLGCLVCVCSDDAGPPRAPSVPEAALQSSPPHCDGAVSPACRAQRRPGAPASCVSLAVGFWRIKTQRECRADVSFIAWLARGLQLGDVAVCTSNQCP